MLSPTEIVLDTEDNSTGRVCVELQYPDLVKRDVEFRFDFLEGTAGIVATYGVLCIL